MRPLPEAELHLWEARLEAPPAGADGILALDERERASRFRSPADRARWVAARCALRQLLGGYVDAEPGALRLRYGPQGKPGLDEPWRASGIEFNVSHTGDRLLIAVARGARVGVDLETVRPVSHLERVARRVFPADAARLLELPEPDREPEFFRLWSRLEATAKLHGEGVWRTLRLGLHPPGVTVRSVDAPGGFVAAVAAEGEPHLLRFDWPAR